MKIHISHFCCLAIFATAFTATAADPSPATTMAPASPVSAVSAPPSAAPAATVKPTPPPRTQESAVTPAIKNPERHTQFLQRIKQGEIGLLFLGDSITDFWPKRGVDSWAKYEAWHPADFGISGDRTEHLLWRILNGELDGINPKVTVIMIGTNNIGQSRTEKPEWAAAGVKKIVEVVHQKLPQTKVLLLAVFPRSTKASQARQAVNDINKIISGLDDGKTTFYLDIGNSFLDANGELPKDVMPDMLHPTAKGYDIWYTAMQPTLEKLMK